MPNAQPASFHEFFENLSSFCEQHKTVSKQLVKAKDKFFFLTGKLKENEQDFNNRVNSFLWWFFFDFRLKDAHHSPLFYYKEHLEQQNNRDAIALLNEQIAHIHSLFKFIKIKNGQSRIKDIVTGKKYLINDENSLFGFVKGIYFETRLFSFEGQWCLANYFIRHPIAVKREMRKKLKPIRKDNKALKSFFLELHSYYTKWHKYRSININNIYHFDQSIPGGK